MHEQLSTLGDGRAGNQIRLLAASQAPKTDILKGPDGYIENLHTLNDNSSVTSLEIGGEERDIGVFEFDLSGYLDLLDGPNAARVIERAELALDTFTNVARRWAAMCRSDQLNP